MSGVDVTETSPLAPVVESAEAFDSARDAGTELLSQREPEWDALAPPSDAAATTVPVGSVDFAARAAASKPQRPLLYAAVVELVVATVRLAVGATDTTGRFAPLAHAVAEAANILTVVAATSAAAFALVFAAEVLATAAWTLVPAKLPRSALALQRSQSDLAVDAAIVAAQIASWRLLPMEAHAALLLVACARVVARTLRLLWAADADLADVVDATERVLGQERERADALRADLSALEVQRRSDVAIMDEALRHIHEQADAAAASAAETEQLQDALMFAAEDLAAMEDDFAARGLPLPDVIATRRSAAAAAAAAVAPFSREVEALDGVGVGGAPDGHAAAAAPSGSSGVTEWLPPHATVSEGGGRGGRAGRGGAAASDDDAAARDGAAPEAQAGGVLVGGAADPLDDSISGRLSTTTKPQAQMPLAAPAAAAAVLTAAAAAATADPGALLPAAARLSDAEWAARGARLVHAVNGAVAGRRRRTST